MFGVLTSPTKTLIRYVKPAALHINLLTDSAFAIPGRAPFLAGSKSFPGVWFVPLVNVAYEEI